jgi:hypothetical protein
MSDTIRRNGVYRRRWQWWFPWGVTDWWRPRAFRGGDEWCNDSACLILPPLGCFVVFWRPGRLRVIPCPADWADLTETERADYAPCGRYYDGRIHASGHMHREAGACDEARAWLNSAT